MMKLVGAAFGFVIGALVGYLIGIAIDGLVWNLNNIGNGQVMPQLMGASAMVNSYYLTNSPYNAILLFCIIVFAFACALTVASRIDD